MSFDFLSSIFSFTLFHLVLYMSLFLKIYLFIYFDCTRFSLQHAGSSLQHAGSLVAACRLLVAACRLLSCSMHVGSSSLTGIEPRPPALGGQTPTHWNTRKVPIWAFYENYFLNKTTNLFLATTNLTTYFPLETLSLSCFLKSNSYLALVLLLSFFPSLVPLLPCAPLLVGFYFRLPREQNN